METAINLQQESNGFLDCIRALNWEVGGWGGHCRIAFNNVYHYSLKVWKDAYDDMCEKKHGYISYQEYIDWMNATQKDDGTTVASATNDYKLFLEYKEREKAEREKRDALIRKHRAIFENACEDLYYGYGKQFWLDSIKEVDISAADADIVWKAAFDKMAND